jgi:predicted acyl esterase
MHPSSSSFQANSLLKFLALLVVAVFVSPLYAQDAEKRIDMVPMRDGVRLATNIYLPEGDGP